MDMLMVGLLWWEILKAGGKRSCQEHASFTRSEVCWCKYIHQELEEQKISIPAEG